jgi:hypothetical protein
MSNAYGALVSKPERKNMPGRCRCRWEDNMKMDLRESECEGVDDSAGSV